MKKALIIGVSGQDGAYLASLLLKKNYEVFGASRDAQKTNFHKLKVLGIYQQISLVSMAVNDFRSVLQVIHNIGPDEIYNLGGQSSVELSFQQPMETLESISYGTLNILEAIRFLRQPVKFFNACSSECFGNTGNNPADESSPFRPRSPYAVAKAAAFWAVVNYREAYNLFACSGILFNHESPLRPDRFVTQKIVAAACRIKEGSNEKLQLGNINIERDWGWAPEFVEAMWLMLQQGRPDDFVIATGTTSKLSFFLDRAFAHLGLTWQDHITIADSLFRPEDLSVSRANAFKAKEILGWQAKHTCADVVRMMVDSRLAQQT